RLSELVEHKLFQRLRDMPQLELLNLKDTGATHTRQQHSILMLRNARYYLAHLLNGPFFRLMTSRSELEATLILALIRGVGHYQLSHFFEDYAAEQKAQREMGSYSSIWQGQNFDIPSARDLFQSASDWENNGHLRGQYGDIIKKVCLDSCEELGVESCETLASAVQGAFSLPTRKAVSAIYEAAYHPNANVKSAHLVLGAILNSE